MIRTRLRRLALLLAALAAPAVIAGIAAAPAGAATAAPATVGQQICANGGAGLCLQNNGNIDSLVANDTSNTSTTQQYEFVFVGGVQHSTPSSIGWPFNKAGLNNSVAAGRNVWQLESAKASGSLCLDYNSIGATINYCTGSQSYWVQSGSGRMISVGDSNSMSVLEFLKSNGVNGSVPADTDPPGQTCPGACWSGF